jgi:hypothetical protein
MGACCVKVAVIFTGFLRTFNYTKASFKQYIMDPLDTDVFISTPKTFFVLKEQEKPMPNAVYNCPDCSWHEWHLPHSTNKELVDENTLSFFGDRLKSYELRSYNSEIYKALCQVYNVPEFNFNKSFSWRTTSQLFSIQNSVSLFKRYVEANGLTYDLVIMTRGDNKYFTPFDLEKLDLSKINYADHNRNEKGNNFLPPTCCPSDKIPKAFIDQLLVGTQNNMLIWSDVGSKSFSHFNEGMYYTTENLMAYHLMKNNIDWCGNHFIEPAIWRLEENE